MASETDISNRPARPPRSIKPILIGLAIAAPMMIVVSVLTAYLHSKALREAAPAIDSSAKFILLVGSGQISEAKAMCVDQITEQQLTDSTVAFDGWGAIVDVDKSYGGKVHSISDIEVQCLIKFDRSGKLFVGHWDASKLPVKLLSYEFKDAPASATQPAK